MTKLEEIARAICQADEQNGGAPWEWYGSDKARQGYFDQARAVLSALKTPTPGMIEAGRAACGWVKGDEAADIYRAMIDAAEVG